MPSPTAPEPVTAGSLERLRPTLAAIARTAAKICGAHDALIFRVEGEQIRLIARHGRVRPVTAFDEPIALAQHPVLAMAARQRRTVQVRDLKAASRRRFPEAAQYQDASGTRTVLATPLVHADDVLGVMAISRVRVRPFTAGQIALLKTFADQAAIAIENARLSQDLRASNRELGEALEQQTATAEILKVISRSPTDIQPV